MPSPYGTDGHAVPLPETSCGHPTYTGITIVTYPRDQAYRVMSEFAAHSEPGTDVLADMPKVVFSSTLSEPLSYANTQLAAQDLLWPCGR